MQGFSDFIQNDIQENMWRNLGAGAALLGAGLGGYSLMGSGKGQVNSPPLQSISGEVDRPMLQNMDYEELVRDYITSHQNDPQYKTTFGKNRIRTDAEFFAAKYLRDKAGGPKNQPFKFTTQHGKVVGQPGITSDPDKEIPRRSGSVDD